MKLYEAIPLTGVQERFGLTDKTLLTRVLSEHTPNIDPSKTKPSDMWPGKHKGVIMWWKLSDGTAVAWKEDSVYGDSFPVIKLSRKGTPKK